MAIRGALYAVAVLLLPAAEPGLAVPYSVIDVHGHALPIDYYGPVPQRMCLPLPTIPVRDVRKPPESFYAEVLNVPCPVSVVSPSTEKDLRERTLSVLKRRNILSLVSGPTATLSDWKMAAPDNILEAQWVEADADGKLPPIDTLRTLHKAGKLIAIAEVGTQYGGVSLMRTRL